MSRQQSRREKHHPSLSIIFRRQPPKSSHTFRLCRAFENEKKDSESFFFHQWGYAIYTHTARSRHFIPGRDARKSPKVSLSLFFLFVIFKLVAMFSPTFSLSHQLPSLKRLGQLSTHESFFGGEREWKQLDKFTLVLHKERKRYDLAHIGLGRVARVF